MSVTEYTCNTCAPEGGRHLIAIDPFSGIPVSQQIVDGLLSLARAGVLSPYEKLPSVRDFATTLRVSPNTVMKAFRELESLGVTGSASGLGTYVMPREKWKAAESARPVKPTLKSTKERREPMKTHMNTNESPSLYDAAIQSYRASVPLEQALNTVMDAYLATDIEQPGIHQQPEVAANGPC